MKNSLFNNVSKRWDLWLFGLLALLMIATRGSHFSSAITLPGASTAVFFLAGFYCRSALPAFALLALAVGLDVVAVAWGGVSAECFGPAYPFLGLAYLTLWTGGRWAAKHHAVRKRLSMRSSGTVVVAALASSVIAHLLSSGSFYLLSGYFGPLSFAEFSQRVALYYPYSLQAMAVYIGCAAVIHLLWWLGSENLRTPESRQV